MKNWVHLARHTVRAEIPEFEVLYSMRVFNLSHDNRFSADASVCAAGAMKEMKRHCDSLGEFIGVPPGKLHAQLEDLRPIAQRMLITDGACTTVMEAWQLAIKETQSCKAAALHPVSALRPVLMAFGAYGPSTSGLEQNFAQLTNIGGANTDKWSSQATDELVIKQKWMNKDIERAIRAAPKVWAKIYGVVRATGRRKRLDFRKKRGVKTTGTESSFIRNRRAEVDALTTASNKKRGRIDLMTDPGAKVVGEGMWTDRHEKEVEFQQQKRSRRMYDSFMNGEIPVQAVADDEDMEGRVGGGGRSD